MYLDQIIKYKDKKWTVVKLEYMHKELMFIKLRDNEGKTIVTTPDNLKNEDNKK